MLELSVLIVCHFTEMTSLDQHIFMTMQEVERTGDKVSRTGNIVAGSFDLDKSTDFCRKSLTHLTLSKVCTRLYNELYARM